MTQDQLLAFSVIGAMMGAFILDRFRYDVVAVVSLLVAVSVGIVSPREAFSGFSNDIVIIVGSALMVSAAVARSGVMENLVQRFWPGTNSLRLQLAFLVISVTFLSAFVKNIGALAIMLPVAFQFARRAGVSASVFLMPMAFGALMGGLMTQIGTSPNVVVSQIRERMTGTSFTMFDFTPVGATIAAVGVVYLVAFYWILPMRSRSDIPHDDEIHDYICEARVPAASPVIGKALGTMTREAVGNAMIVQLIRNKKVIAPLPDTVIAENDILLFEGTPKEIDAVIKTARLVLSTGRPIPENEKREEIDVVEAVITDNSPLIGISAKRLALFDRYDVNLLAVSRQHERIRSRIGSISFRLGDLILLQGRENAVARLLRELKCLSLARRPIQLGSLRRGLIPLFILGAAIIVTALQLIPVALAFFAAAVAMVVFRAIPARDIYQSLDGQILIMLAALIPVSEALEKTGCTELIGTWLSSFALHLPPFGALAVILVAAMLVTPFLNNAATVMVMAPIASSFATSLNFRPEAFLMAVAIGAGCDFLTPVGHQCNMLVMGPGGYRFADYPRLGAPLAVLIVLVAVPMLMFVWPLS